MPGLEDVTSTVSLDTEQIGVIGSSSRLHAATVPQGFALVCVDCCHGAVQYVVTGARHTLNLTVAGCVGVLGPADSSITVMTHLCPLIHFIHYCTHRGHGCDLCAEANEQVIPRSMCLHTSIRKGCMPLHHHAHRGGLTYKRVWAWAFERHRQGAPL